MVHILPQKCACVVSIQAGRCLHQQPCMAGSTSPRSCFVISAQQLLNFPCSRSAQHTPCLLSPLLRLQDGADAQLLPHSPHTGGALPPLLPCAGSHRAQLGLILSSLLVPYCFCARRCRSGCRMPPRKASSSVRWLFGPSVGTAGVISEHKWSRRQNQR